MSTDEFFQRLQATLNDLRSSREASALLISKDAMALLKRRIINHGKDHQNKKIGDYSTKVVPFWMFKGKEKRHVNAVEELYEEKGYFASYRDWRVVNNLEVAFKNFSFTGHMWASVYPLVVEKDSSSVTVGITAGTDNAVRKLRNVIAKHPAILNLAPSEVKLISDAETSRVVKALGRHGILDQVRKFNS